MESKFQPWDVIGAYFRGQYLSRLVEHQHESYNYFVTAQIQKTIEMFNPIRVVSEHDLNKQYGKHSLEIHIRFGNFLLHRPQIYENNGATTLMFPSDARLRNFTYASSMTVDMNIVYTIRTGTALEKMRTLMHTLPHIHIGKLPIMLRSSICVLSQYKHLSFRELGECEYDPGGYFIVNGGEKTVLGQERSAENRIYCYKIAKLSTKYSISAEIKSVPNNKCVSPKQVMMYILNRNNGFGFPICVQIPRIKSPVPLFVLFRALGVISDMAICGHIVLNEKEEMLQSLQASVIDANTILTQQDAIRHISTLVMYTTPLYADREWGTRKKHEFTMDVLQNDIFPHCNTAEEKVNFLGYMTNRILQVKLEWQKPDDRDSYLNKRVDTTGVLLNNLFRSYYLKMIKDMEKQIVKEINTGSWKSTDDYPSIITMGNIYKLIKSNTVENGIKRALSTGDFGVKTTHTTTKVGVAQVLNRLTYAATLSHARRISTPTDKSGKLIPPRKLHNTSWGFMCPVETPEGQSVGIVKNLSYMTHITVFSSVTPIYDCVKPYITVPSSTSSVGTRVFINGTWIGVVTDDSIALFRFLKQMKYAGRINIFTSVLFDMKRNEIRICNDAGRVTRPLLRVANGKLVLLYEDLQKLQSGTLNWNDMIVNGNVADCPIEYIDAEEQSHSLIAISDKTLHSGHTHCEIHASTIFGVLASCIPFPEHNQSPRNTYQSAMGKQAMGVYVSNFDQRMDRTAYVLTYPTRPLVDTRLMNILNLMKLPSGTNVIVAIMTHTGYNQEDSLLVNKGSIDRGLFQATIYHTEKDEYKQNVNGEEEIRCKPDPAKTRGMKYANYDKVNSRGVIPENTLVENRDVIIAKITPIKEHKNDPAKLIKFEDHSHVHRTSEETFVERNFFNRNSDGFVFCRVRLRSTRKPVIGDKFSSRHGQKGTIGNIIPEEDMPFTASGIRPDIIINPHAIPSRMTIGQLKETLVGKLLLTLGLFGDGTSFNDLPISEICKELQTTGFESNGNELLYNGKTGEQLESNIFIGPVFYQRLKHMVIDKEHSRSIGPMVNLTRQPAEGRSRDGGLRFGEMERDCMIAHGAARFTRGRLYDSSDKYEVYICNKCGLIAAFNDEVHVHLCKTCQNRSDFSRVEIPYACKLFFHELMTMNVTPRLITEQ